MTWGFRFLCHPYNMNINRIESTGDSGKGVTVWKKILFLVFMSFTSKDSDPSR